MMSAGAVAQAGTIEIIGLKNIARRKSTATVSAVRPVRPPCSTPLALSTKVVTVEVPSTAPAVRSDSVGHERLARLGQAAFFVEHVGTARYADKSTDCVKEVNEEEGERDAPEGRLHEHREVHLHEYRRERRRHRDDAFGHLSDAERYCQRSYDDDADEDAALYAARLERDHEQQAEDGEQRGDVAAELAEAEEDGGIVDDDAGALEADEGYEEPDARRDAYLERLGYRVDDLFADLGAGEHDEDHAFDEDRGERDLPRYAHAEDDREGEEGVEPHARRERERVVREEGHKEGRERRAEARGYEDGAEGHSGLGEYAGVDEDDVGHRDEGRDARHDLLAHVGAVFRELELPLKPRVHEKFLPKKFFRAAIAAKNTATRSRVYAKITAKRP